MSDYEQAVERLKKLKRQHPSIGWSIASWCSPIWTTSVCHTVCITDDFRNHKAMGFSILDAACAAIDMYKTTEAWDLDTALELAIVYKNGDAFDLPATPALTLPTEALLRQLPAAHLPPVQSTRCEVLPTVRVCGGESERGDGGTVVVGGGINWDRMRSDLIPNRMEHWRKLAEQQSRK